MPDGQPSGGIDGSLNRRYRTQLANWNPPADAAAYSNRTRWTGTDCDAGKAWNMVRSYVGTAAGQSLAPNLEGLLDAARSRSGRSAALAATEGKSLRAAPLETEFNAVPAWTPIADRQNDLDDDLRFVSRDFSPISRTLAFRTKQIPDVAHWRRNQ
jgi:hypothetical protein